MSRATKSVGRAILNYIRHLDDDGYIERLRTRAPLATLARTAAELVASDDHTVVSRATLFAQDGCRLLVWRDFRRELAEAGFFDTLRANLAKPDYFIRRDAVVTLGHMAPESVADLVALFARCVRHDPLLLGPLLAEMCGEAHQDDDQRTSYVRAMAESPSHLTRWAAVEAIAPRPGRPSGSERPHRSAAERLLARLAADAHPLVRAEAAYRLRELRTHDAARPRHPRERTRLFRPVADGAPLLTFAFVKLSFERYLWMEGIADYDLALLDAWACWCTMHPLSEDERRDMSAVAAYHRRFTATYRLTP